MPFLWFPIVTLQIKLLGLPTLIDHKDGVPIDGHFFRVAILRRHGPALSSFLTSTGEGVVSPERSDDVLLAIAQLLDPLEWLHSRGFAHGDIKVENVRCFRDVYRIADSFVEGRMCT